MATTSSARAHPHHQHPPYGLRYEPLRRMRGLDVTSALQSTAGPRAPAAAVAALLGPLGASLLGLSALALAATLTGAALATPLLLLFSPVLVPAALGAALAAAGLAASGALGVAGVSALAWAVGCAWTARAAAGGVSGMVVQPLDDGKQRRRGDDGAAAFVGHRLRE
ncbi:hypothetical protein QOZ80_6BG0473060 [Eleusine coracana subsp. coracana]|nr:hypothetical protein QOZ80_6BG0473060 [Eleusine coracana subsp. coracana]